MLIGETSSFFHFFPEALGGPDFRTVYRGPFVSGFILGFFFLKLIPKIFFQTNDKGIKNNDYA